MRRALHRMWSPDESVPAWRRSEASSVRLAAYVRFVELCCADVDTKGRL